MTEPLVSLSPPETLVFELERDTAPKAILRVTNTSNSKVVFKVKTTQPSWYYVRPNQQVIAAGQTEEVAIVLVDSECSRFLERAAADKAERLDKHRFLLQTKVLSDEDYDKILGLAASLRSEEYTRIWGTGPKDERKNLKLKVDFLYPKASETDGGSGERGAERVENDVRSRLSRVTDREKDRDERDEEDSSPESLFSDLLKLRMKYDAVVEYTVHLTAERDTIVNRLEETDRELARESGRRRAQGDSPKAKKMEKLSERKISKGFSLMSVLIAALFSFLLGRYFKA